jgi:hypothetical protein
MWTWIKRKYISNRNKRKAVIASKETYRLYKKVINGKPTYQVRRCFLYDETMLFSSEDIDESRARLSKLRQQYEESFLDSILSGYLED